MGPEILRRAESSPTFTATPSPAPSRPELPPDFAEKAGQRLALVSLAYAAAYTLLYVSSRMYEGLEGRLGWADLNVVAAVFVGISLLMFAVAVSGRVAPERLLGLGLLFEVVGAAGIEIDVLWWPVNGIWAEGTSFSVNGISWTCVWIIVFTLVVPATPGRVALTAFAAASVRPALLLLLWAGGISFSRLGVDTAALIDLVLPNYVCAALAIVTGRIVWGYGHRLHQARRMGSYRLVEKLGEGGMGEVWKAEHRMLARPAAIKVIRPRGGTQGSGSRPDTMIRRFEREVQATAELRSPHTVMVYDFGFTEDRRFYYVMELLDGLTLQAAVERFGPMPAERVVHVLRQACDSLAEAHERGMVHRDVKPGNIFLCRHGREVDFVKVLDFGLVKHVGPRMQQSTGLTGTGTFAGTPAYGAPEEVMGSGDDVDARSDLYSLGCVAFWLLTGRTVFEASTSVSMLVQHASEEPDPPSAYAELEVPPSLDRVVLACLAKDRGERPESADDLSARLEAVELRGAWTVERARHWWDAHVPAKVVQGTAAAAVRPDQLMVR